MRLRYGDAPALRAGCECAAPATGRKGHAMYSMQRYAVVLVVLNAMTGEATAETCGRVVYFQVSYANGEVKDLMLEVALYADTKYIRKFMTAHLDEGNRKWIEKHNAHGRQ